MLCLVTDDSNDVYGIVYNANRLCSCFQSNIPFRDLNDVDTMRA